MKNGYTIPELIVVTLVLGVISIFAINKVSYAFVTDDIGSETTRLILEKSATAYANSIKEDLKSEKFKHISSNEIINAGFLIDDENTFKNYTIELQYNEKTDSVSVEVIE